MIRYQLVAGLWKAVGQPSVTPPAPPTSGTGYGQGIYGSGPYGN
jgi:hypothetical protein